MTVKPLKIKVEVHTISVLYTLISISILLTCSKGKYDKVEQNE